MDKHQPEITEESAEGEGEVEEEVSTRARASIGGDVSIHDKGREISASLGAMRPLIGKLDMLLLAPPQRCFSKKVKDGMRLLRDDIRIINSYLHDLSELEDAPLQAKCWMNEARNLSYDMEDYINNLLFVSPEDPSLVASILNTTRFLRKIFNHVKTPKSQIIIADRLSDFRMYVQETIERHKRYNLHSCSTLRRRFVSVGPTITTQYGEEAADIVVDGRMNEFINSLVPNDEADQQQRKVVSVLGSACLGKTTLAKVLYNRIQKRYHCRAFVRVSKKPDMKRIFRDMLSQLQQKDHPQDCNEVALIERIKEYLQDKRYLIIVDDVWAASAWVIINRAFPEGCNGSRIVTTTQIEGVALTCCYYQSENVFEMKPLDNHHSRKLFFNRLVGSESDCPEQFKDGLNEIVEICGGLPLATISIASLLASQPAMTEDLLKHVHESLSSRFSASSTYERTRQALDLSFNNLPQYLRTCLMYLSMYQEGYRFCKDDLVKQWVAEGFIDTTEGQDVEKVAESYLHQLICRRFIQPVHITYNNEVLSCVLHDVVHDLIAHKCVEENFVLALDYSQKTVALSHKVRRLSLLFGDAKYAKIPSNIRKSQVRSLGFFGLCECMPGIGEFKLLCVLNLQLSGHRRGDQDPAIDLTGISGLFRLRYLKIVCDVCIKLPNRLRGLQCLETLDVMGIEKGSDVPWDIIYLPHLLHLSLPIDTNLLDRSVSLKGIGKLNHLQDLYISTPASSDHLERSMEALGSLIGGHDNLKTIVVVHGFSVRYGGASKTTIYWNNVAPPTHLQRFECSPHNGFIFYRIPRWMEQLGNLCTLKIALSELLIYDVGILSRLPALTSLSLYVGKAPYDKIIFDKAGFSALKYIKLRFTSGIASLMFEADAMPNLLKLRMVFNAIPQMNQYKHGIISIDHMPSLEEISMKFVGAAADLEFASGIGVVSNHLSNPIINVQLGNSDSYSDESTRQKQQPDEILEGKPDEYDNEVEIPADKRISSRPPVEAVDQLADGGKEEGARLTALSVVTGAINSVVDKLTGLLGDEVSSLVENVLPAKPVMCGIQYLRNELSSMKAVLLRLSDMEEHMDPQTKVWRDKVRDMSFDIEDCIDRFIQRRHSHGSSEGGPVKKAVGILKRVWDDLKTGKEIDELKAMIAEESERRKRYKIDQFLAMHPPLPPMTLDLGAHTQYEAARNLVGIDAPREKIIGWLVEQDTKPNVVAIFGIGGSGKTTLALEVYNKIQESFDCWAFISFSRTPDIKSLLKKMLFQINIEVYKKSEMWDQKQLILKLREQLKHKRYLIVIDDIWTTPDWQQVKYVLPMDNNKGSRIIATTRSNDVAGSCCADLNGHTYEAKLLTDDDSRSLFFRRVFPSSQCCPQELREVADDILKKCGGLPLAIISIGGLLANKSQTVEVWLEIRKFVSSAVEKYFPLDLVKIILLLSYFDIPPRLKPCLLYLSVFPEDYYINSRFLIWKWMAEGLIDGENREDMERLGESYLNEFINRSMIEARKIGADGTTVKFCGVHDIILEFIKSLADKENFVTVLNDDQSTSRKIRWLSLHLNSSQIADLPIDDASHLRSVNIFGSDNLPRGKQLPPNCEALRVLNIEGAMKSENCDIEHIGRFYQLKYLRISDEEKCTPRERASNSLIMGSRAFITELPEEIGNLHHLEVLDIRGCIIRKLPTTIFQLKKLVHLFVCANWTQQPDGIGNLQCLEELSMINLGAASVRFVQELGELAQLRALEITWMFDYDSVLDEEDHMKVCASPLSKLVANSLRSLRFTQFKSADFLNWWVFPSGSSPPPLRRLVLKGTDNFGFPTIPSQISSLTNLTRLHISRVCEMGVEGVNILASLPMLISLTVRLGYGVCQAHVISSQGFQRLVKLHFIGETCLTFEPAAMPKLHKLKLVLTRSEQYNSGGFVQGLLHLSSLKHISIGVCCWTIDRSVEDLMDEIRSTTSIHPNQPILDRI